MRFWHFKFDHAPAKTFELMWVFAKRQTREYFVESGQIFERDINAARPIEVGMTYSMDQPNRSGPPPGSRSASIASVT